MSKTVLLDCIRLTFEAELDANVMWWTMSRGQLVDALMARLPAQLMPAVDELTLSLATSYLSQVGDPALVAARSAMQLRTSIANLGVPTEFITQVDAVINANVDLALALGATDEQMTCLSS